MRAFLVLAVLVPVRLAAQQGAEDRTGARLRVVTATVSISLDGRLDGAAWAGADSITEFRQREPSAGAPASERTVVKVLRDAAALYVAVRAYDGDMRRVRASELRRDADLSSDDNVQLLIDSFHDRRGAFVFGTNPNGAMWDAQLVGIDNLNQDWNGIWDVVVTRDSASWTAEFRIPFRTLRFHRVGDLRFGFNVRRFIRRKNEQDLNRRSPTRWKRRVRNGIRNSAVQLAESRVTTTSQMPFQSWLRLSIPTSWASHIAPFGLVPKTKAPRRS